jgi:hypothetical protein
MTPRAALQDLELADSSPFAAQGGATSLPTRCSVVGLALAVHPQRTSTSHSHSRIVGYGREACTNRYL